MTAGPGPTEVPIGRVAEELGLSTSRVRGLTAAGILTDRRTPGGHRRYDLDAARAAWRRYKLDQAGLSERDVDIDRAVTVPGDGADSRAPQLLSINAQRTATRRLALKGLEEDQVWRDLRDEISHGASPAASRILGYTFTEMLNNAIDHSSGTTAWVDVWREDDTLEVLICDDGSGVFAHLSAGLGLADDFEAIQELSKGKRTTAPARHTGEGIFFTSKAVDVFRLAANGLSWTVDNIRADMGAGAAPTAPGTRVRLLVELRTTRDLGALFRSFTSDMDFTRSRPVVKLFSYGVTFVSRSEAKRLLAGLEKFTDVDIDFTGVTEVGQGFVDEVLRVWPVDHPGTTVTPINMVPAVEFMVTRGLAQAENRPPA